MVIQAGDPRDLYPVEQLRQDVYGIMAGSDETQDTRLGEALDRAYRSIEQELAGRIVDGTNEYEVPLRCSDESLMIRERWHRTVAGVMYREADEGLETPPGHAIPVASVPAQYTGKVLTLWPPGSTGLSLGRWPEGVRALTVSTTSGLSPEDVELGDVRKWLLLLVRFEVNHQMEMKPTNAIRHLRHKLVSKGWTPRVSGGEPLRDDEFGLMGWTRP